MRPLYIEGSVGCRVVFDEPALRVVVMDKADQLFPLSRVSRVVCSGVVDWSMSALLACADAGVNVLFLAKNGEVRGRWLGQGNQRQLLAQRLVDLLARPDGLSRYENWYLAVEKLAARSFARRLGLANWREISVVDLRRSLQQLLSEQQRYCANAMQTVLLSEVLIWLADADLASDDENLLSDGLDLADDFSRLLLWDFYGFLLSNRLSQADLLATAGLFEQQADRFYLLFRSTVNKLHQFLLGIN
ncbi:MAG: CRISPR-associated endonuclease Cas1 [Methylomonas sp.]